MERRLALDDSADSLATKEKAPSTSTTCDQQTAEAKNGVAAGVTGGSMRKKLSGKTYHHIKDMFATKFGKTSKTSTNSKSQCDVINNATVDDIRPPESIHSMNQRIHSQITQASQASQASQGAVWGSYGRSVKTDATISELDASVLAKLTLNPTPTAHEHPVAQDYKNADYR